MPMLQTPIDAAAGAATNGGRRPTVVAVPAAASPELSDRPRRRTFTAQEKLRILAETDRAADTGGIGAVLMASVTAPPRRRFRRSSISILRPSPPSARRADTVATSQR